ncbi:MAG: hypothetical protein WAM44_02090 [Chthoniobacterales bacterium]
MNPMPGYKSSLSPMRYVTEFPISALRRLGLIVVAAFATGRYFLGLSATPLESFLSPSWRRHCTVNRASSPTQSKHCQMINDYLVAVSRYNH